MIQIITGKVGEGKTKQMITLAKERFQTIQGHIVYIDSSTDHRFDIPHQIRLVEPTTIPLRPHDFYGFLCGILSSDHDIELIFIDELVKLTQFTLDEIASFIEHLQALSTQFHTDFIIGTSCSKHEFPPHLEAYLVA